LSGILDVTTGGASSIMRSLRAAILKDDIPPEVLDELAKILFDPTVIPRRLRPNPITNIFNIPRVSPSVLSGVSGGGAAAAQPGALGSLERVGLLGN